MSIVYATAHTIAAETADAVRVLVSYMWRSVHELLCVRLGDVENCYGWLCLTVPYMQCLPLE